MNDPLVCPNVFNRSCSGTDWAIAISDLHHHLDRDCFRSAIDETFGSLHEFEGSFFSTKNTTYLFDNSHLQNFVSLVNDGGIDQTVQPTFQLSGEGYQLEQTGASYKDVLKIHRPLLLQATSELIKITIFRVDFIKGISKQFFIF